MPDLLAHAVDAIRPQQVHSLLHQVGPPAVEHPEAQILQELGLGGRCVQLSGGAETILGSAGGNSRSMTVIRWELIWEIWGSSQHSEEEQRGFSRLISSCSTSAPERCHVFFSCSTAHILPFVLVMSCDSFCKYTFK